MSSSSRRLTGGFYLLLAAWLSLLAGAYFFLDWIHPLASVSTGVMLTTIGLATLPLTALLLRSAPVRDALRLVCCYGVFFGLLTALRHADWDPRKPFVRVYSQIRPGLTVSEVEYLMRKEFRWNKLPHRAGDDEEEDISYFLDPDDGRYNSEILWVHLKKGVVTNAEYHPD